MDQPIASSARQRSDPRPMPPGPPRYGAKFATAVLLTAWLVVTFGAHRLAPPLGRAITAGEHALGLDDNPAPKEAKEAE